MSRLSLPPVQRLTMRPLWLAAGLGAACPAAHAQFALAVSPPRFEISAEPGKATRQVIELSQVDSKPGSYSIRTAEWQLRPDGSVEFREELAPGSCRPWVAIERREVVVSPARPYRYRIEVAPPEDTPATECRFAVLIEGKEQAAGPGAPIGLAGRIGVIVYVAVGKVQPALTVAGNAVQQVNGQRVPVLKVRNDGSAHGRLSGFLGGTDASGTALEFTVASAPILPGETRDIALTATRPGNPDAQVQARFPVTVRGKLEWGASGSMAIDERFGP